MPEERKPYNANMNWDPNADILIKGYEWEEISNMLQIFQSAIASYGAVVARNVASGIIKVTYRYDDGTEVPPAEVERDQRERLSAYTASLKAAEGKKEG